MDQHTFIGKRRMAFTDINDFTDYQGVGHDPLYKRYDSVNSVLSRHVVPEYRHFLASPDYVADDGHINWYINEWNDVPERLVNLDGELRKKYETIKNDTVSYYSGILPTLQGEDLMILAAALKYIDDNFIYCADGKVFLIAWGMRPEGSKHLECGKIIHELECIKKCKVKFDAGSHGRVTDPMLIEYSVPFGHEMIPSDVPDVESEEGYKFSAWDPAPVGREITADTLFRAQYRKIATPPAPPVVPPTPPTPPTPPVPDKFEVKFNAGEHGKLSGAPAILALTAGTVLTAANIPTVTAQKGYKFKGWDSDPLSAKVTGNKVYNARYEKVKKKSLWGRWWWWLLLSLLALLLIWLLAWLLGGCTSCSGPGGILGFGDDDRSVREIDRVDRDGVIGDDNGIWKPIPIEDGKLPPEGNITAPIFGEDGEKVPVVQPDDGSPAYIENRLFIFLSDDNDDIDRFAEDFKRAYPGDQYAIVGYDRDVKSLVIQFPAEEREQIREQLPSKIPGHNFVVLDEEIYMINNAPAVEAPSDSDRGWHLEAVHARQAWDITRGDKSVKVAVVDDGIDANHPIFAGRIVDPYNVFTQDNRLSHGSGHGTHTAGLAAGNTEALNQGAAGMAPDCMLMPIQVFDNGMCPASALISGIMYAVHKDADVVNVSIGPSPEGLNVLPVETQQEIGRTYFKKTEQLWNRVCQVAAKKKTIIVFAAGNEDIISSIIPANRVLTAISVGAVDQKMYPTWFTNYGDCTDISAPGAAIYSSVPGGKYNFDQGTSMAAPIVTGTIALMKSLKRDINAEQARNVLYRTGRQVYGMMPPSILADEALRAVQSGDFSAGPDRGYQPVPEQDRGNGDTPDFSSWNTTPPAEYVPADSTVYVTVPGQGSNPGVKEPVKSPTPPAVTPGESDQKEYEEIRRLIKEYERKIEELRRRLPSR